MNDNRFAKLAKNGKSNTGFLEGLQNVDTKAGHQQEDKHTGYGSIKRRRRRRRRRIHREVNFMAVDSLIDAGIRREVRK